MVRRLRERGLTFANVASVTALFVALAGGTAYGAGRRSEHHAGGTLRR